jgi:hypothetical protein
MRIVALAVLSFALACASEESGRVSDTRTPVPTGWQAQMATPAVAHRPAAPSAQNAPPPVAQNAPPPIDPREATRHAAHDALVEHCGECHEGHRPTAKPKALAVFDLDRADWPSQFDAHKYDAAAKRLASKSPAARDAFIAFRDAELAAQK